ncbi:sigma-70 family RNA polymerase sigma factor [Singulisphaera sp. PoT]|uniref:sigma-70 family RNA polymerase sigma factor n=1 Tax=Singulisphaera sp. PoT TaxID=3411797 RepID=UPI003BF51DF1
MAGHASDHLLPQVNRIFNLGAVGTLTDAQLLDWFVSRRDGAAEAAFEELMNRHGPMVSRVCRSVLQDGHDAEDALQATFLVLAHRAGAIRRGESVASWLFGVAHRVSSRARKRAARQRALDQKAAGSTPEASSPAAADTDWEALHQEVDRLPERLRAPVVLCYLEGLTYAAAAGRLNLSEGSFRGRMAQARERLRRRLTERGMAVPAGLLLAGTLAQSPANAAVPAALVRSTTRIALGFLAGSRAAVLARGVLRSMLLNQIRIAAILAFVGLASGYGLWHAYGAGVGEQEPRAVGSVRAAGKGATPPPVPQPKASVFAGRFTGSVTVEGTGQAVAGARLQLSVGFVMGAGSREERIVESGADGRFAVDLPAGDTRVWVSDLPAGYLFTSTRDAMENLEVSPDKPEIHRDFRVRKGTVWDFQFVRGSDPRPFRGHVMTISTPKTPALSTQSQAQADERGRARLTLSTEESRVELYLREHGPITSSDLDTGILPMALEWESGFRPDRLEEVSRLEGKDRRFRLVDADGKSAVLDAPEPVEPINENSKLLLRVTVSHRDARDFAALTGEVLDEQGRAISGAHVAVTIMGREPAPGELRYRSTTDRQGRYRLRDIPRWAIDGKPLEPRLSVRKEGYGGVQIPVPSLADGDPDPPIVVEPIRLERGVSIGGTVVDHLGRPAAGASVQSIQLPAHLSGVPQGTRTDENGKFLIDGLHRGVTALHVFHGKVRKTGVYLVDGSVDPIRIVLPEHVEGPPGNPAALLAAPPGPAALGEPAPDWQVSPWSDGRVHQLADERGKVVVLYFWGVSFWQSVSILPALGELRARFEPRGVDFLAIHNAEKDEELGREQGRKVLAFKGAPLTMAIDQSRIPGHARGKTLQSYGGQGFPLPVIVIIDRAGRLAYRSDTGTGESNLSEVFMQMAQNPRSMTEPKAFERVEGILADEIGKALKE